MRHLFHRLHLRYYQAVQAQRARWALEKLYQDLKSGRLRR